MRQILILAIFSVLACNSGPSHPGLPTDAPEGIEDLLELIELSAPGLEAVANALGISDTLAATEALLTHFRESIAIAAPHIRHADPLPSAEAILAGTLLLSPHLPFDLPSDPDWSEDPFGDSNWRFQYHTFRWPMSLLYAYQETGDTRFLDRFLFLLEDYARDNLVAAPPSDMTWYDMAAALRTEHWLYAWKLLVESGEVDQDLMIRMLPWIWVHGDMLRNVIPYEGSSNHGMFHSRSLVSLGLVFPEFSDAMHWRNLGTTRLDDQLLEIVSAEGVSLEQSVFYHFYTMLAYDEVRTLLQAGSIDFSPAGVLRLEKMPAFCSQIFKPDGSLPIIGDTSRELGLSPPFGRDPTLDFVLSGGVLGDPPMERCISYNESGYVIFRSGWGETRPYEDETQLIFDTGPRGSGHGHFDAQSIVLSAYGKDLIVDSGNFNYSGEWRDYFKGLSAHNVLVPVESVPIYWPITPERLLWRKGEDWAIQVSKAALPGGRQWRRVVVYLDADDFILIDDADGEGPDLELLFHFAPDTAVDWDGVICRVQADGAALDLLPAGDVDLDFIRGAEDPIQGWYAPAYGRKEPNSVARIRPSNGEYEFRTLLHAHRNDGVLGFSVFEEDGDVLRFLIQRDHENEEVLVDLNSGLVDRHTRR